MSRALSLVVTTFDNESTIGRCIESASFADEILVLDSFSTDRTVQIAEKSGAHVVQEAFRGYGPQKQRAIDLARHDFVLLLDADEVLSDELAAEIEQIIASGNDSPAFRLRREEWLYWQWPRNGTRLTDHLRLFDRRQVKMGDHPVHAAPEFTEPGPLLTGRLRHYGHADLDGQVRRINFYTSASLEPRGQDAGRETGARLLAAPMAAFFREFVIRRQFLNGWSGYITARMAAWHAFLRHAKRMEAARK